MIIFYIEPKAGELGFLFFFEYFDNPVGTAIKVSQLLMIQLPCYFLPTKRIVFGSV